MAPEADRTLRPDRPNALLRLTDSLAYVALAVRAHRNRSLLSALGIAVGITAVTLLTAIGESLQGYVAREFTQFGTNLIAVAPGKRTTAGRPGGVLNNIRPLTVGDAEALRTIPGVDAVLPVVQGNVQLQFGRHGRRTTLFGAGKDLAPVWRVTIARGRSLPDDDPQNPRALAVLGAKVAQELFRNQNPVGQIIRAAGSRYRVVGLAAPKGQFLGFDLDDVVFIPATRALELFNRESLMEVDVHYLRASQVHQVTNRIKQRLLTRHGEEDFTINTQEQMLEILGSITDLLTLGVAALGGISLLVGAVGILTMMTIAVQERLAEIGLLRALGGTRRQVVGLFLGEAIFLSAAGGVAGLLLGTGTVLVIARLLPHLPVANAWAYVLASLVISALIGLLTGIAPALHAARVDPITALRAE